MSDIIHLKPGDPAPLTLDPGELAIDEANGILYTRTQRGAIALPLDRVALEPRDDNASSEAYLYSEDDMIAKRGTLDGGGGAQARNTAEWRVFGLAPKEFSTVNLPVEDVPIEVTFPTTVRRMRVRVMSGSEVTTLTLRLKREDGVDLIDPLDVNSTGAGAYGLDVAIALDPGRYLVSLEGSNTVEVEAIAGFMPWFPSEITHVVTMSEDAS